MNDPAPRPREGRCACGAVTYRLNGEPLFVHACHCLDCQRLSGSAFGITVFMIADDVELLGAEILEGRLRAPSGHIKTGFHCVRCGSYVYSESEGFPGCVSVRGGSLDKNDWLTPRAHIWVRSRQPWFALPADTPSFDTTYERSEVWPADSLRRLQALTPG